MLQESSVYREGVLHGTMVGEASGAVSMLTYACVLTKCEWQPCICEELAIKSSHFSFGCFGKSLRDYKSGICQMILTFTCTQVCVCVCMWYRLAVGFTCIHFSGWKL